MKLGAGVLTALALSCAGPVAAQDPEFLRNEGVEARNWVLDNISGFQCGEVKCLPASPEGRLKPPVTDDDAAVIAGVAVISAFADYCGLDWSTESFIPMMRYWRAQPGGSDRKFALIAGTHGFVQERALQAFQAEGECDDQTRAAVQAALDQNRD